jgi:hypothetical protein
MRIVFRELQKEQLYDWDTVADQLFYTMPSDMEIEFINYVGVTTDATVDEYSRFQRYLYASDPNVTLTGYNFFASPSGGELGLYPILTETGGTIRARYFERPTLLSSSDLTAQLNLKPDWQNLLVYGAIAEIANSGNNPDTEISNNYRRMYNDLLRECKQNRYERMPVYPSTKDVMKFGRFSQRYTRNKFNDYVPEE